MAGFYADVPAPRMAFDRDGTVGFFINLSNSALSGLSAANLTTLINESSDGVFIYDTGSSTADYAYGLIFPQLRDVIGIRTFHSGFGAQTGGGSIQYSVNTTNGVDGTWVSAGSAGYSDVSTGFNVTLLRTGIATVSILGIKGLRVRRNAGSAFGANTWTALTLHLYGSLSAGETPDRLRLWHPTLDEPLDDGNSSDGAYLDWGDVVRGTSQDRTFRIKNNSGSLIANSIAISPQVLTDTSPTVAGQHTLSDGGAFAGTINIGNLTPGSISSVITLRRTTASNAALSLWTGRLNINPGSWS